MAFPEGNLRSSKTSGRDPGLHAYLQSCLLLITMLLAVESAAENTGMVLVISKALLPFGV